MLLSLKKGDKFSFNFQTSQIRSSIDYAWKQNVRKGYLNKYILRNGNSGFIRARLKARKFTQSRPSTRPFVPRWKEQVEHTELAKHGVPVEQAFPFDCASKRGVEVESKVM